MPARAADPAQTLHWRDWYSLQRWRRRAKHQLRSEPLCRTCLAASQVTPATIADHIEPHRGDWNAFRLGALQSLCAVCHERKHGRLGFTEGASRAVDESGFPVDPRHPFNKARG